jgi:transposase-like protein
MRAFLSSACERFLSLFVWVHELLTYDATLYPHARTASTREVTAALTYGLEGPPSLSAMLRHSRLKIAAPPTAITAARIGCRPGSSPYAHVGSCPSCTPCFPSHPLSAPALRETSRREPFIKDTIEPGTLVYTDEYSIYARLERWGYAHKRVNHGRGEYARDEDGDGFCEVHVNTMEGFWSLLRSWLRPHRGISQEK